MWRAITMGRENGKKRGGGRCGFPRSSEILTHYERVVLQWTSDKLRSLLDQH